MKWEIIKNEKFGYMEVIPKPPIEELQAYYSKIYYQDENATYTHRYEDFELTYFNNKINEKYFIIEQIMGKIQNSTRSLCDVGCGEGFTLDFFFKKGWKLTGLDFSEFAIKMLHPHLLEHFIGGDIFLNIEKLVGQDKKFNVIWLDNVLEHVIDPQYLLNICNSIGNEKAILVIEVPNDFSDLQKELNELDKIEKKYWVAYPDHLSYFSKNSLIKLVESCGWKNIKILADYPIEITLLNDHANYWVDRSKGKQAHYSRITFDNLLHKTSPLEDIVKYYEALAKLGHGRQITGFFVKE